MSEAQTLDYRSSGNGGESDPVYYGLPLSVWFKTGVVASLVCAVFWPNLRRLWEKTNPFYGEANWGHAVCVPLIGLYYLYVNRDSLRSAPVKTSWWGLLVLLVGILVFGYGIWPGQNDFVKDFGMVVTLFGVVLLLAGWRVMKVAWFPIAFLTCAIPWPGLVYSWIASPLQQLAANVAVSTLQLTGVKSFAGGTKIFIYGQNNALRTLNVAEACAGLRSLMTFVSVAAAVAFLSTRPLWQKIVVVVSAVPIAIFCNVMRVAGQGLLDHYVSQELSESFAHQFVGLIMLIPAFVLILLVGWVLDQIFVEELTHRRELATKVVRKPQIEAVPLSAGAGRAPLVVRAGGAKVVSNAFAKPVPDPFGASSPFEKGPVAREAAEPKKPAAAVKPPVAQPQFVKPSVAQPQVVKPPVVAAGSQRPLVTPPPSPAPRPAGRTFSPRGVPPKAAPPKPAGADGRNS